MLSLQVALLLTGVAYVASMTFTVPIYRPDNKKHIGRMFARKNGTGDEELESEITYYRGIIRVGTPEKEFEVDFDTGSPTLWLMSSKCTVLNERCSSKHSFVDPSASKTGNLTTRPFEVVYGDQSFARGYFYEDFVSVGTKQDYGRTKLLFGLGDQTDINSDNMEVDGIFGLSFHGSEDPPTAIEQWLEQGTLDGDLFTVWMSRDKDAKGEIAFGGLIPEKCGPIITKASSQQNGMFWDFKIDSVKIDGKEVAKDVIAITDTGTTQLVIPEWKNVDYFTSLDQEEVSKHNMTFTIAGHDFTLNGKDLYGGVGTGLPGVGVDAILGDIFIKQFCQVHYVKTHEVGFARNKIY